MNTDRELLRESLGVFESWHPQPGTALHSLATRIDAHLSQPQPAADGQEPTEAQVEQAAKVIAASPLIDAPKLPAPAWMGLARAVLQSARPVAAQEVTEKMALAGAAQIKLHKKANWDKFTAIEVFNAMLAASQGRGAK